MYVTPTAGLVALHTETARYTDGRTTGPRSARKPSDNAYRHSQPHKSHNSGAGAHLINSTPPLRRSRCSWAGATLSRSWNFHGTSMELTQSQLV